MEQTNNTPLAPQSPASDTPPTQPPAPAAGSEAQAEQPKYVTKEELAEAIELGFRRAQKSARSHSQNVEAQVKALAAKFEKAGGQVTEAVTQNLRQQVEAELDTPEQPNQPVVPGTAPASAQPGQGDPVYDWTMAAYQAEGIDIKPTDPEFNLVTAALNDPAGNMPKYQKAVFKAIETKRERIASQQSTADARTLGGSNQPPGDTPAKSGRAYLDRAQRKT